ncbi:MAG: hypothetical protein B6226_01625 [Candidatus Cloacimonetes bacterium 4572_65]|nr:MAG: hypothetical protein B6226_01625 [Candidatus Cloacimonetes bacterium 4572_65]
MYNSINVSGRKISCIAIGVSAGGMKALITILESIGKDFPVPILITQHLHKSSDSFHLIFLDKKCNLIVKEAENFEPIKKGHVYFAPVDYHLLVESDKSFMLSYEEKVRYSRPSIDVMFESVSEVFQDELLGIVLTGANDDGTYGVKVIKENGGITIAQEPATSEFPAMPQFAIDSGYVDYVMSLEEINKKIFK